MFTSGITTKTIYMCPIVISKTSYISWFPNGPKIKCISGSIKGECKD